VKLALWFYCRSSGNKIVLAYADVWWPSIWINLFIDWVKKSIVSISHKYKLLAGSSLWCCNECSWISCSCSWW
jgi:hypothetical protein